MINLYNFLKLPEFFLFYYLFLFAEISIFNVYGLELPDTQTETINLDEAIFKKSYNDLLPGEAVISEYLLNSPMPELKDSQIGRILTNHYNKCLGGRDHWKTIKSIKVSGTLSTEEGLCSYEAISKKPNLYKIKVSSDKLTNIVAYNGKKISQKQIANDEVFLSEISEDIDRIVNETQITSYLLFPFSHGKVFQYRGTVRESNFVCHQIRLYTKSSFIIDYYIDVESYNIITACIVDKLKKFNTVSFQYSDHRLAKGISFAHKIDISVNGKWDSSISINNIKTNIGAMKWMFSLKDTEL